MSSRGTRELEELSVLLELSQKINISTDLQDILNTLLDILSRKMGMTRGTITLLKPYTDDLLIEAAHGMSYDARKRGHYKLGEGITGKVASSGKPMVISNINDEPRFLNKTKSRNELDKKNISFICVPIKIGKETIGALSVDKLFQKDISLDEDLRLLTIISSMVGQAVKIHRAINEERDKLRAEAEKLRSQLSEKFNFTNIIGNSSQMHDVYVQIHQASKGNASILIRGESGTGKELVAHAIHYNSIRSAKPFVKVNCAAIPAELIEAELFGHEKGAFTDAHQQKKGKFELAHGGTILLDEVGDLSMPTQVKLLRVLQEKEFERVGGIETIKTNFRLISATNKNLEAMIKDGLFREDLYYRLNVFCIFLPPLRDRRTDILLLAEHFLKTYAEENNKKINRISTPAIDMMMTYHWPGNVRELENCIERAVLVCDGETIHGHHLPPSLQTSTQKERAEDISFAEKVATYEKDLIIDALKATRGNISKTAELLRVTVRVVGYKMKQYNIDYKNYR
ncbi:sigma-54-dependent Fis family transcriptional regulator [Candidatus Termititenax persephonae]|uniref:Sigma-54-dependent Fis family transcriptional regulator n=1 Tax=Candidatus Termititenax persephonae TaxID=2218525 RepID=A0A388TF71_9BACT|nr:sigma-54-dependent Fis family transcriptional regulator [Candidatus Termititenax persephonae]